MQERNEFGTRATVHRHEWQLFALTDDWLDRWHRRGDFPQPGMGFAQPRAPELDWDDDREG
jgi:hypothetical protein